MKTNSKALPGPSKKKCRLKFSKPADAIRLLNRVIHGILNDEMEIEKARCLIYACSVMGKIFETSEHESRLAELEERLLN
jgi:hypothetical protein